MTVGRKTTSIRKIDERIIIKNEIRYLEEENGAKLCKLDFDIKNCMVELILHLIFIVIKVFTVNNNY